MDQTLVKQKLRQIFNGRTINLDARYGISEDLAKKCIDLVYVQLLGFSRDMQQTFLKEDLPALLKLAVDKHFQFVTTIKRYTHSKSKGFE